MAHQQEHNQQLKSKKYRNWVKAGLGLKYIKEGLETFSNDVVKQQQTYIINAVKQKHNLLAVNCGVCSIQTLQPDHVRNRNKQCPPGQTKCNCQFPGGKIICPNNVCGAIYDQIVIHHASNPPAPYWKNTDVQNWCTDAWTIAKCYINSPGYATKANAAAMDCTGLLHLFINSKYMQTKIQCKITGQDVFSKTRSSRNEIYHSNSMEMEDFEVNEHIDNMIAVLKDGKELLNRQESQDAVLKLKELKNSGFVISTQSEAEVIKEALAWIHNKTDELKEIVHKAGNDIKSDAEFESEQAREKIKTETRENVAIVERTILERKGEACTEIKQTGTAVIENIRESSEDFSRKEETSVMSNRIKHIEEQLVETNKEIWDLKNMRSEQQKKLAYIESKKDFQKRLVEMYFENVVKVSPILLKPERTDINISQLYVKPLIYEGKKPIASYSEIFEKDIKQVKSIYLIGEAGTGKSSFCLDMIHNWCLSHSNQCERELENQKVMETFQFLFYISLRNTIDTDHIETMVRTQYPDKIINSILEIDTDDCLILLDGLDEWCPPLRPKTVNQFQTKGIPTRDLCKGYTVLTTSRPWKIESLPIKSTEINKNLKLCGIYDSDAMAEKIIKELNKTFTTNKKKEDFLSDLSKCTMDRDMKSSPIVLQQLICLWFEGNLKPFGQSELYSNIVSLYFEWANLRNTDDPIMESMRNQSHLSNVILPEKCIRTDSCEDYKYVINQIGRLAFETLFLERKECSLSFDNNIFRKLEISEDVIQCCLNIGVLSKERDVGLALSKRQRISYSFVHKSLQEFLASVFLFVELHEKSPELFKMYTLENVDESIKYIFQYLGSCTTVNDILEKSNVIIFLCGFDQFLAAHLSKFIFNICREDDAFTDFRRNIKYEPFEIRNIEDFIAFGSMFSVSISGHTSNVVVLQNVLFSCIREAMQQKEKLEPLFFLADVAYKPLHTSNLEMTKLIRADYVSSLSVYITSQHIPVPLLQSIKDTDLGKGMSALKIYFESAVDFQDSSVLSVVRKCIKTLDSLLLKSSSLAYHNIHMRKFFRMIIHQLPELRQLRSIKLDSITLPYSDIINLCRFLTNATYLRQISLRKITDNPDPESFYAEDTDINLSEHHHLQVLDHDFETIEIESFNVVNLEMCAMRLMKYSHIRSVFSLLRKSKKLKHLHFIANFIGKSKKVTSQFRKLLVSLKYLTTLELDSFHFSDSIIADPSAMNRLKMIKLIRVTIQDESLHKFLDDIISTPRNIQVETWNMSSELKYEIVKRNSILYNIHLGNEYVRFATKPIDI